jgi:transaldolase
MSDPIRELTELGQSLWYDNIERRLLENGELAAMIGAGEIRGMTSNPSIFQKAISESEDYDAELGKLAVEGLSTEAIYEALAVADIRAAADLFRPVYEDSDGEDGFISLEVSPLLAHDTEGTFEDARRLWARVDRPNLMVKIPATDAGLPAIERSIAAGININVTLIFSRERYQEVMDAYLSGLESRVAKGLPVDRIASVASFFVSRIDSKVDGRLENLLREEGEQAGIVQALRGRIAIANARLAYQKFRAVFEGPRFTPLKAAGARVQRPLWASTSTKNPAYPDVLYVEALIGPDTVNTVPPATLQAFKDHGRAEATIEKDLEEAEEAFSGLEQIEIDFEEVTGELEDEGVKAFAESYTSLLETVEKRRVESL